MKPGIYTDLSNADYHGGEGTSKSLLDVVARSPMHAKALLDTANDNRVPTAAQAFGSALHTLLLEPHLFADEYVCELTQADAPHAIADRQVLVDRVTALNENRLAKLATGGTKEEQLARILAALAEMNMGMDADALAAMKGAELKSTLEFLNKDRPGKLSISGTNRELADILEANGHPPIVLWTELRARWNEENEGYTVLSVDTFNQLLAMQAAVHAHPAAHALLTACEGVAEASVYATDPSTGELRRVRPDFWRKDGVVVDVKSTIDASPPVYADNGQMIEEGGFAKSLANYGYHRQAPYYLDTMQLAFDAGHFPEGWAAPKAFVFLAVEKAAPHAVACYVVEPESHEIGRQEYREALNTLAECKRTGVWGGYGDAMQQIGVPTYYMKRKAHLLGAA